MSRRALLCAAVLLACDGGNTTDACAGYCEHISNCAGSGGAAVNGPCQSFCADAALIGTSCDASAGALTAAYRCMSDLPCSDFSVDGGGSSAVAACLDPLCR